MGTSQFAILPLQILLNTKHEILAVYTKKPKKGNRGYKLINTPVYELALHNNIKIFTPNTFKNPKNLENIKILKPDLIIVVSYGLILTKDLLEIPTYGCINIHPSILPKYRGCAPMERCLMSNDTETGVCIMKVDEGLDTGDVIGLEKIPINKDTDIQYLKQKLSEIGAKMLIDIVNNIEKNKNISYIKQNNDIATFTEKITNADAIIDWKNESVIKIHKKIMALNDSVTVTITHNNNKIKILKSDYILENSEINSKNVKNIGQIIDKYFSIQCIDGVLKPLVVQRESKKIMNIKDFINGYKITIGEKIQ